MKEPTYRQALVFALRHTFKHPFLWIYGLFAAILGQIGIFDFVSHIYMSAAQGIEISSIINGRILLFSGVLNLRQIILPGSWVWLVWIFIFCLGVIVFFLFTAIVSQGALIHGAAKSIIHPESFKADTRAWHAGVSHFWRLLTLQIVQKIVIGAAILMVAGGTMATLLIGTPLSRVLFLVLFLLATVIGVFVSFLTAYTAGYIVVEDYPLADALHAAFRLFREHWLVSLEVSGILAVLNIFLALIAVAGFFLLLMPITLFWLISALAASSGLFTFGLVLLVFLFVCLIMLLGSTFTVFVTTVWTYLFMKMHREGVASRILHWMKV